MAIDWDSILRDYGRLVWQRVYRLLGNHADASDCFQDVFVSALSVARQQPIRNWPGFLRRLATTRALDRLRQRMRHASVSQDTSDLSIVAGQDPTPEQQAESGELSQRLREALVQLPTQQADAFCFRFFDGLSYEQIAEEMSLTSNAVGVLIHRARARLQTLLSEPAPGRASPAPHRAQAS